MASVGDLSKYRDGAEVAAPRGLSLTGSEDTTLLAVDQTLGNCALVGLVLGGGRLSVGYAETLRPSTDLKGNAGNLERSMQLQEMILDSLRKMVEHHVFLDFGRVIYETPPAANRMQRPESSLLAAHCLRWAVQVVFAGHLPTESIGAQRAKAHVCGNSRATKAEAHKALTQRYGDLIENYELIANEHLRDALMLGLTYLEA